MRNQIALATTTALALALAGCGGAPEADDADNAAATDGAEDAAQADAGAEGEAADGGDGTAADSEGAAGDGGETEEPVTAATPAPEPAPTPSQTVAVTPPASFSTCGVCHSVEPGQNMIGPSLAGVFGREAGTVSGATYSPSMQEVDITWDEANLRRYITDPAAVVPGGTMPNPGASAADVQAIVDYLKTL